MVHDSFTEARDRLAVVISSGHGIDAPVDEHANFASRHHAMRASCWALVSVAEQKVAPNAVAARMTASNLEFMGFICQNGEPNASAKQAWLSKQKLGRSWPQ
jgi:hypothetical protein